MKRFNVNVNVCVLADSLEDAEQKISNLMDDNQDSFDWYEINTEEDDL